MQDTLDFTLNGSPLSMAGVSPNTTLLEFLRQRGLTGSKEGCAEGDCGACSVVLVAQDAQGKPAYRAVNSCLMPVCLLAGREVLTVEGVGSSAHPHPVQEKMATCYGSQCGYCTPGFICSMFEGYYRNDLKTEDQLDDQLSGNLCRCTGYRPIRDAAIAAFGEREAEDAFTAQLSKAQGLPYSTSYQNGEEHFFRPGSLMELLGLIQKHPDAKIIAGATELGLEITKRYKRFPKFISVESVPELRGINSTPTGWQIGAAVTLTEIKDVLGGELPELDDMLRVFGSRQIRNRATMGGNIVTASPIGDSAPVLLALDAQLVLAALSADGAKVSERTISIESFFISYRKTALQLGEVLKSILIPKPSVKAGYQRKAAWYKVSRRREMDISTVSGSFAIEFDSQNVISKIRLAYGGVAATPLRAKQTEAYLLGKTWSKESVAAALEILKGEFQPLTDVRGSKEYRLGLIGNLLESFYAPANAPATDALLPVLPAHDESMQSLPHESAHKHVTGEALYVDDSPTGGQFLEVWPVCSPHARARILKRDATFAKTMPGIRAVLLAEDIPGRNDVGAVKQDEILLADTEAKYHGHLIALVVGVDQASCRAAAEKVVVEYETLPPILSLRDALEKQSFHNDPNFIRRGDCAKELASSPLTLEGEFELGGQEHFYLETNAAWARPEEDGAVFVSSSTQHPSEVQQIVSHTLHIPANKITVTCPRMGGGFGGKETQAATPAALAALAATITGQPVRVRWNRDQDMMLTGHRHPFLAKFKVGYDSQGLLRAAQVHLWSDGGWAQDLSQAVTDRALFHLDNCYYLPSVEFQGQVAKTNKSSNTAFRGFGGPQGMLIIEEIMDRVARRLGLTPETVRERNLYHGTGDSNTTHYGQLIADNRIQTIWSNLKASSAIEKRRAEIATWNASQSNLRRGIAMTPVKFGISFTVTHLNQAGALVLIYQDGSVQVNHGGTEMGQGLHTNVAAIVCAELGILPEQVRMMHTSTDKVPNTSATAASAGTDLNGAAAKNACEILRARLLPIAQKIVQEKTGQEIAVESILLNEGFAICSGTKIPFADIVRRAYMERVSLSASGYYATPGIHWDRVAGRGKPFHYFAYGAAVTEVELDRLTGMHKILRVDILHDVGNSVNPGINRGQIEGGFVQGAGWLTTEELVWDDKGRLLTHSPDTYKIPSVGDAPKIFNVTFLRDAAQIGVVHGSKAVGEPPFMLAISVREAIRDAIAYSAKPSTEIPLASPATAEAIWRAAKTNFL